MNKIKEKIFYFFVVLRIISYILFSLIKTTDFFKKIWYNNHMELIYVGKIVNTFGIKGELKIVSRFEMAKRVFVKGNHLIINKTDYEITNVRFHKNNYLVELNNIKDINKIEYLINEEVYFAKENLNLTASEYLIEELLNYKVVSNNEEVGVVTSYDDNKINPLIKVNDRFYIPIKGNFILNVDKTNKVITVSDIRGLMLWK